MVTQTYAIDNGFHSVKAKTETKQFSFLSRIQITTENKMETDIMEYKGERYKIGVGTDDIDMNKTKKQIHKICALAALHRMIESDNIVVARIAVAMPLSNYKNKQMREEYKEYLVNPQINTVRYNSIEKTIIIKDAIVFAQGGAALYAEPSKTHEYKNSLIGILDWGGLTVNGFIAENMMPISESMFTINLGTIILYNRIKTALNENFGLNVQDYEVPYILKETPTEMKNIIENVQMQIIDELISEMRRKNWSIETIRKVGVGGGFLVLGEMANRSIPKLEVLQDPVYANVKGLYNVAKVVWK
jgi:hypothetical protein